MGSAVWIAHSDVFPQLATMALNVGTGGGAVWLGNGESGPPVTILGRPVIFTEKAQTLGTAGDLFFIDLSQYLIGDRQAMTMSKSEHVNFTTDEQVVKLVQRVDGRPWLVSALTPRNGSNTVSPYINLATRA
jgi:HK97 family phage major capsid protein